MKEYVLLEVHKMTISFRFTRAKFLDLGLPDDNAPAHCRCPIFMYNAAKIKDFRAEH